MVGNVEKAQHLRRCSPQTIRYPRVACTIVWQPWAIKNTTPTALIRLFYNTINANIQIKESQNVSISQWIYFPL